MLNYIQDNENIKDSAIGTMLKDVTSAYKSKNKKAGESAFSNILNNLSSKTQKTQTNFVDKVARTNTSSINRKVFDNSSDTKTTVNQNKTNKSNEDTARNAVKNYSKNSNDTNLDKIKKALKNPSKIKEAYKNENASSDNKNTNIVDNQNKDSEIINVSYDNTNENTDNSEAKSGKIKQTSFQSNIQNLSDINDNSSVDPSPVFLQNDLPKENTQIAQDITSDDVVAVISAALSVKSDNNTQLNKEDQIEEVSLELISSDNIDSKIEEISNALDEFGLTKDNQEDIKNAFDKIKEIKLNSAKADFSVDINPKEEIKQVISDLAQKLVSNNSQNGEFSFGGTEKTLVSSDLNSDFKKPEINLDFKIADNKETVAAPAKEEQAVVQNSNVAEISEDKIAFSEQTEPEIVDTIQLKPDTKEIQPSDFDTNTEDIKIKPDEINNSELIEYDDEVDFDINDSVKLKDKIALDNQENIKNVQENPQEINQILSNEDSQELIKLIKENNSNEAIDENIIAQNIQNSKVQKVSSNNDDKQVEQANNSDTLSDDNVTATNVSTDNSQNNNFNDNAKNNFKQASNDKISLNKPEFKTTQVQEDETYEPVNEFGDVEISEDNVEKTKLYAKVEQNSDTKSVKTPEENLEKIAFEEDALSEMIVSMSKETVNTSALTVADEVAKIAINENTSINSPLNVVYDSMGDNILLKNVQAVRPQENIFNQLQSKLENSNILSQIAERFEQIKDSINQKFTMVLRPNDLGRLSVELTNGLKGLVTNIIVQNDQVRSFIEKNINMLKNQLASAGVNVNQIQIKTAGSGETSTYSGNQNFNQNEGQQETFKQNENNQQEQNKKQQFERENLLAGLSNFDTGFADDFSNVLNKTISYGLN